MSIATSVLGDRLWAPADIGDAIGEDECWRRYEIVDGVLVVSPQPSPRHDSVAFELAVALREVVPAGFFARTAVGIDLGTSYRVTDATIVSAAYLERHGQAVPSDVLIAIEVESPTSITTDRITKPAQYAQAGVPHYWRVELDPLRLIVHRLAGEAYVEVASWGADDTAHVTDPFDVTIDLWTLLP